MLFRSTPYIIKQAGINAINNNFTKYTVNVGINDLRKLISEKLKYENNLNYSPEEIAVSTGAKQSVYNAIMATVNAGDEVIIPAPYYVSYPEIVKLAGGIPVFVKGNKNNNLKPDIKDLQNAVINFPESLWLFSASGTLCVMKKKDGDRVMLLDGGVDPDYIVATVDVENDGGDW